MSAGPVALADQENPPFARTRQACLLKSHRRYFALLRCSLLAATPLVGRTRRAGQSRDSAERRAQARAPRRAFPRTGEDWLALPGELDAYLKDHFGLRQALIRAHKDLTKPMLGRGDDSVLIGRDGRMFYLGEEAVRQSAGLVLRDQRVADAVELVAAINGDLARQRVRFLVASPPNAASVYQDDLPDWAQNRGRRTEYDLFLEGLAAKGVKSVDLRPAMEKARAEGAGLFPARHALDCARRARGL